MKTLIQLFKVFPVFIVLGLFGCETLKQDGPQKEDGRPSFNVESMQTENIKASKRLVFDSTITVFKKMGYVILSSDFQTGIISAKRAEEENSSDEGDYNVVAASVRQINSETVELRVGTSTNTLTNIPIHYQSQVADSDTSVTNINLYSNTFRRVQKLVNEKQNNR